VETQEYSSIKLGFETYTQGARSQIRLKLVWGWFVDGWGDFIVGSAMAHGLKSRALCVVRNRGVRDLRHILRLVKGRYYQMIRSKFVSLDSHSRDAEAGEQYYGWLVDIASIILRDFVSHGVLTALLYHNCSSIGPCSGPTVFHIDLSRNLIARIGGVF